MANPYLIEGPANISFSGGRTSGYMLRKVIDAHGGRLPLDVQVGFTNTGKEREETLIFVDECDRRWGAGVHWIEWRATPEQVAGRPMFREWLDTDPARWAMVNDEGFAEVTFETASRGGEPFMALIAMKNYTPNAVTRFCSSELKVRAMRNFYYGRQWKHWVNAVGLRHDEGHRCLKAHARNAANKEPFKAVLPLDVARVTKADVMAFWAAQPFDLGLKSYEGNCDNCFLKSRAKLCAIIREQPGSADWWIDAEVVGHGRFVTEYSYAELQREVAAQPHMFDAIPDDGEAEVECTTDTCGGETPAELRALQREWEAVA